MFVACGISCLADVSSVSPSSEQTFRTDRNLNIHLYDECEISDITITNWRPGTVSSRALRLHSY